MSYDTRYDFPSKPINRFGWLIFLVRFNAVMQFQSYDNNFYRLFETNL